MLFPLINCPKCKDSQYNQCKTDEAQKTLVSIKEQYANVCYVFLCVCVQGFNVATGFCECKVES